LLFLLFKLFKTP